MQITIPITIALEIEIEINQMKKSLQLSDNDY